MKRCDRWELDDPTASYLQEKACVVSLPPPVTVMVMAHSSFSLYNEQ